MLETEPVPKRGPLGIMPRQKETRTTKSSVISPFIVTLAGPGAPLVNAGAQ